MLDDIGTYFQLRTRPRKGQISVPVPTDIYIGWRIRIRSEIVEAYSRGRRTHGGVFVTETATLLGAPDPPHDT